MAISSTCRQTCCSCWWDSVVWLSLSWRWRTRWLRFTRSSSILKVKFDSIKKRKRSRIVHEFLSELFDCPIFFVEKSMGLIFLEIDFLDRREVKLSTNVNDQSNRTWMRLCFDWSSHRTRSSLTFISSMWTRCSTWTWSRLALFNRRSSVKSAKNTEWQLSRCSIDERTLNLTIFVDDDFLFFFDLSM